MSTLQEFIEKELRGLHCDQQLIGHLILLQRYGMIRSVDIPAFLEKPYKWAKEIKEIAVLED